MMLKGLKWVGGGGVKEVPPTTIFLPKKIKVSQLFAEFRFSWEVLEPNCSEKRGMDAFSSAFFLTEPVSTLFL
jgi:hypothetical protein